jgi:hypothetical protein
MRLSSNEKQHIIGSSRLPMKERIIESQSIQAPGIRSGRWIALTVCAAVLLSGVLEQFLRNRPDFTNKFAPNWIAISAAVLAAAGIMQLKSHPRWLRIQGALRWSGLLIMVWAANGLPFDLLRLTRFMPIGGVDWLGLASRTLALAAVVVLARLYMAYPATPTDSRPASWYGYAAFVLALPYPVLRICWAFGGMIGITIPGAAGSGFAPLLFAIPWMLAAALSLLLVSTPRWMPRRLLLVAGWTATVIVAMIGPMACWTRVSQLMKGTISMPDGMKIWIPCLFYGSWFLWAIAAGAATRSYQLRSACPETIENKE